MQVKRSYSTRLHVDKNNRGPSALRAFGDFTGGELWVYDPVHGTVPQEVTEPLRGPPCCYPADPRPLL